jgi:signal peptidase I
LSARTPEPIRPLTLDAVMPELLADVLRQAGEARVRVTGTSMLPAIQPGDVITIRPVAFESVAPGDVVMFAWAGRLLAHRVVETRFDNEPAVLMTQGDQHDFADPPVSAQALVGRVSGVERGPRASITLRLVRSLARRLSRAWVALGGVESAA